ncbi:MAG: hypothetical protein ABL955_00655 [Elusimicrobiota bacterium]
MPHLGLALRHGGRDFRGGLRLAGDIELRISIRRHEGDLNLTIAALLDSALKIVGRFPEIIEVIMREKPIDVVFRRVSRAGETRNKDKKKAADGGYSAGFHGFSQNIEA